MKGLFALVQPFLGPLFEKLGDPAADGMKKKLESLANASAAS
jgi:hypothetical protein